MRRAGLPFHLPLPHPCPFRAGAAWVTRPPHPAVSPLAQMLKVAALVCVCAAAWCSPALAAAAAGGRPDSGNFLDDKQWLTTISQYDKEVGQWNKFRDVSSALPWERPSWGQPQLYFRPRFHSGSLNPRRCPGAARGGGRGGGGGGRCRRAVPGAMPPLSGQPGPAVPRGSPGALLAPPGPCGSRSPPAAGGGAGRPLERGWAEEGARGGRWAPASPRCGLAAGRAGQGGSSPCRPHLGGAWSAWQAVPEPPSRPDPSLSRYETRRWLSPLGAPRFPEEFVEVEDDYFRTWSPGKPFDQALDPAKDPCLKMKCSRHKVCVAQDQQTAVCISHRRLTHSMKEAGLGHKQWRGVPISSNCKQCPVVYTNPVCGSDGHTYSSQCKLDYQACVSGKQISVKCEGRCPCPSDKSTSTGRNDRRVCSDLEFREVANRLRDWFKALHESGIQNKKTRIIQRPERTRFDTSILPICKDSLGWMFNRLDTNYDLLLDQSELGSIYLDKNEPCTRAFFNSCDTYKDSLISNNEWCYCFQRQQDPPCQTELSNIHKQQGGKKILGQYIPICDEDGYYKPSQCHGSVGQCWCVDRYGNEVTGSRTNGAAECAIDLETSGDFASGDFHDWTDDEDDEDEIMNDEDEIEDDDEDEGDDDVDDDDDHDGYI